MQLLPNSVYARALNTRPVGRRWPAMRFQNFQIINITLFTGVKSSTSEWTSSFWTNVQRARDKFPITHGTIHKNKDVKAVSSKVQVPPLLRQRHNAATG